MPITITGFRSAATFAENTVNATPQLLDDSVTLLGTAPFLLTGLRVSGLLAEDRVGIRTTGTGAGQFSLAGEALSFGGTFVGSVTGGVGTALEVALLPSTNLALLEALVEALTYANTSDAPAARRNLTLTVFDSIGTDPSALIEVSVTAENDAPRITSPLSVTVSENSTGIAYQAEATDPDGAGTITWSLEGADAALFTISSAGAVRFLEGADFETPGDANADNIYALTLVASDGVATTRQDMTITLTNVVEAPRLSNVPSLRVFAENQANAGPRVLAPNAVFQPGDSLDGAVLRVAGLLAEDGISLLPSARLGVSGTSVSFDGTVIGTIATTASSFTVLLNAAASEEAAQALIRALAYTNHSDAPTDQRALEIDMTLASGARMLWPTTPRFAPAPIVVQFFTDEPVVASVSAMADLDQDGYLDMFTQVRSPIIGEFNGFPITVGFLFSWDFLRGGPEGFEAFATPPLIVPSQTGGFTGNFVAGFADVNGDGRPDFVTTSSTPFSTQETSRIWLNRSSPGGALTVAVAPENDAPEGPALRALSATPEDVPRSITAAELLAGWTDAESDPLSIASLTLLAGGGALAANGEGSWTYTPAPGANGEAVFQYVVTDGTDSVTAAATLDITSVNQAPAGAVRLAPSGALLTADASGVTDGDGLGVITIQWQRREAGVWTDLPGATGPRLAPPPGDAVQELRAVARFTDGGGTVEEVASAIARVGGSGADLILGGGGASVLMGRDGDDELRGGDGAETLLGGAGADTLSGGAGDDSLDGGAGADRMAGGAGDDRYVVGHALDLVIEAAGEGVDSVIATISFTLPDEVENLLLAGAATNGTGNALDNSLRGNVRDNLLSGGAGIDRLVGGEGDDTLIGGAGRDVLVGGEGLDVIRFLSPTEGGDVIFFDPEGGDRIEVSASGFGGGLVAGADLAATGAYVESLTHLAVSPRGVGQFVFETDRQLLWWDADGAGGLGAVLIARFRDAAGWSASDLSVIA